MTTMMSKWRRRGPERTESVRFTLNLDHDQFERVRDTLGDLSGGRTNEIHVVAGDSVTVTYDFTVEYRDIVAQLRALRALLADPEGIVSVDLRERQGMEILFVELVDAIRGVQAELKEGHR